jgi:hypothetical protein
MRRYLRCPGAICCPARRALRAGLQPHIRFCDELIVVDRAEHIGELLGIVGERLGSVLKHRLQHGEHRQGDPRLLALFRLRSTGLGVAHASPCPRLLLGSSLSTTRMPTNASEPVREHGDGVRRGRRVRCHLRAQKWHRKWWWCAARASHGPRPATAGLCQSWWTKSCRTLSSRWRKLCSPIGASFRSSRDSVCAAARRWARRSLA